MSSVHHPTAERTARSISRRDFARLAEFTLNAICVFLFLWIAALVLGVHLTAG